MPAAKRPAPIDMAPGMKRKPKPKPVPKQMGRPMPKVRQRPSGPR